jgi:hypothetical protein
VENYVGDEGMELLASTVSKKLPKLRNLDFDVAMNDAQGSGGIKAFQAFASREWETL